MSTQKQKKVRAQQSRFPFKRIFILFIIALIVDLLIILLMHYLGKTYGSVEFKNLGYDTIRLSIQLILLVLFGGLIVQEYNRTREKKDARNEFRRDVLKILSRSYSDIKGVRRIIRANCSLPETGEKADCINPVLYNEHMAIINSTELELEMLARELEITKEVFAETSNLIHYIKKMGKYLSKVIDEYETELKKHNDKKTIPLSALPKLGAMISKEDSEHGFTYFSYRYHLALEIIQNERLKVG